MKIVILGAGQVGSSVAESLVSEANDITVVDIDAARLRSLQDRLDLRTVLGSAGHPSVLVEAGIEDCDLMIAVTQSDETNLVACKLAQQLFNVPTRIVRLRATDYLANERVLICLFFVLLVTALVSVPRLGPGSLARVAVLCGAAGPASRPCAAGRRRFPWRPRRRARPPR